jgi:hypothetical protein
MYKQRKRRANVNIPQESLPNSVRKKFVKHSPKIKDSYKA